MTTEIIRNPLLVKDSRESNGLKITESSWIFEKETVFGVFFHRQRATLCSQHAICRPSKSNKFEK